MYEQHFGLNKRPFRANATGTDVFVGPHIAAPMAGVKKTLISNDAVVAIIGPAGSGKSTLVRRALESIGENQKIIHVSRMRLNGDDVLDLLLDELGIDGKPAGTIQKFALFRRQLKSLEEQNIRVFVSVEDAVRLGADTLAEIEALTAADAGASQGAGIVLMGNQGLVELLRDEQLARLAQRTRQGFNVPPLPVNELRGYLRHCFRLAGAEFEQVFEANAAELLHHLSRGVPRVTNSLVESAMAAAAEQDLQQVSSQLLARVAENEFGISAADFDLTMPEAAEPEIESAPEPEPVAEPEPEFAPEPNPEPVLVISDPDTDTDREQIAAAAAENTAIPELIQDTLPDLEVLAPELAQLDIAPVTSEGESSIPVLQAEPEPETVVPEVEAEPEVQAELEGLPEIEDLPEIDGLPEIESLSEPEGQDEPEAQTEPEPEPELPVLESNGDDVPAWERDPTMAELRPDLAALEQAMAFAHGDEPEAVPENEASSQDADEPEVIPEITLDHAINQKIESNLIDEPGEVSAPSVESAPSGATDLPQIRVPKKTPKKADDELEKIAVELARAKSLEDVDDKLAETLFGEELNLIAAQFMQSPPIPESANDDQEAQSVELEQPQHQVVNGVAPELEVTLEAPTAQPEGGMDLSASQRLKTVRALNADSSPEVAEPAAIREPTPAAEPPESIEDQITSMTQTLKALNVSPPVQEEEEEKTGGFFSRFKRS